MFPLRPSLASLASASHLPGLFHPSACDSFPENLSISITSE
jgi:hypothetical protein